MLCGLSSGVQQSRQVAPFVAAQSCRDQAASCAAKVLRHKYLALIGQRPAEGPLAERRAPAEKIDAVDLPLVIDADFLQVVQKFLIGMPEALICVLEQRDKSGVPRSRGHVVKPEGFLKSFDQSLHVGQSAAGCLMDELRRGELGGSHLMQSRADGVATRKFSIGLTDQT